MDELHEDCWKAKDCGHYRDLWVARFRINVSDERMQDTMHVSVEERGTTAFADIVDVFG